MNWHYERPSGNCLKDYHDFSNETPPRYGGFQILTTNSGTGPTSSCFYEESYGWWTITARDSHGNKIGDGQILVKAGNGSSGSFAQIDCHYFSGVTCSAGRVTGSQPTVTVTIDK